MEAILINRVSDFHQTEGYSLQEQEIQGRNYAARKGLELIKVFSFQESASQSNHRKIFDEIIKFITNYATNNKTLAVIAEKHDRLYRNHNNKIQFQLFIDASKIEIHLYKEGKILNSNSPPSDLLVDDVMTSVNAYTSRNIGREAKKGMLGKARDGWLPHKAPFGYKNVYAGEKNDKNKRRGTIEPTEWAGDLIPRIFDLRIKGYSLEAIRSTVLNEKRVPLSFQSNFYKSLVEKILKNSFYMGEFKWNGEVFQGKHLPLIRRELWMQTQETFINKVTPIHSLTNKRGALSGFLKCACGCKVTYDPKINRHGTHYDYYRCANGKKAHKKLNYLQEKEAFKQLDTAVDSITITENLADSISEALNRTHIKARQAHLRHIEALKERHQEMENAEDNLYDDMKKGLLDEDGYKRQLERVRSERKRLADILGEVQSEVTDAALVTAKKILELAQSATELYLQRSPQERREFLEKILSNPILDGVTIRYELKKPFSILSKMASSDNWGG